VKGGSGCCLRDPRDSPPFEAGENACALQENPHAMLSFKKLSFFFLAREGRLAMIAPHLKETLNRYHVGDKIKQLRLRRKMGLVELSRHTGLSPALLSKLEHGKLYPTLPTLSRIALVFSVGLEYFFTDEREKHTFALVRKKDRLRFPEAPEQENVSFDFESLDFLAVDRKFNAYLADFRSVPPAKLHVHQHAGVEFIYVLKGRLSLKIGTEQEILDAGDSLYFDSQFPHGYSRIGTKPCSALVITAE
jgi:transcriptional regulator with XRE-family HTH domain